MIDTAFHVLKAVGLMSSVWLAVFFLPQRGRNSISRAMSVYFLTIAFAWLWLWVFDIFVWIDMVSPSLYVWSRPLIFRALLVIGHIWLMWELGVRRHHPFS